MFKTSIRINIKCINNNDFKFLILIYINITEI